MCYNSRNKKNKEVLVASSNSFIGEDFHLKSGLGNKTYLEDNQSFLDVEKVFNIKGKNLKDVDNEIEKMRKEKKSLNKLLFLHRKK